MIALCCFGRVSGWGFAPLFDCIVIAFVSDRAARESEVCFYLVSVWGPALAAHQESAEQAFKVQISEPCPGPRGRKTQEEAGRLVEGSPQEASALT